MPLWFKKQENMKSAQKGTFGFLIMGAIMIVLCLLTGFADELGNVIGIDLVKGNLNQDYVAWGWVVIVVAYCFGAEGIKVIKAKTIDGTRFEDGEFKATEMKNMTNALFITFGMGLFSLILMIYGVEVHPFIFVAAFIIDIVCCIIGTTMANGIECKKLEEIITEDGLGAEDDLNNDGRLDAEDLIIAARKNGLKITIQQAQDMAKSLFGPTGVKHLTKKEENDK